jgi:thiamine biosynthesis lipoprotein
MTTTAVRSDSVARAEWTALGTTVTVAVTNPTMLAPAECLLTDDLAALDLACSRFRADSEIARIDTAGGRPVQISVLLVDALAAALDAARRTDGDVDPTVGSVIRELGYDRDFAQLPPDGPVPAVHVRSVPGWRQVDLDVIRRIVRVPAGVRLDLGATAKAFAADRSAERLATTLGCGVLVSLGGDVAVAGVAPVGGWIVRVQDLPGRIDDEPTGPITTVSVASGGLATSSTAARRWRRGGQWMHHLIDPHTGMPAVSPWRTVTVAAATCLDANVASTCAAIRGLMGPATLRGLGLPARLVANDGRIVTLGGWPEEVPG